MSLTRVQEIVSDLPSDFNWLINGDFLINQRVHVTGGYLGGGVYGFDRWRAPSGGGCVLYHETSGVLIYSGGQLEQEIESLPAGIYTISWDGTALYENTYSSPYTFTHAGGNKIVQWGPTQGTLDNVKLQMGNINTPFIPRHPGLELVLCQRYFQKSYLHNVPLGTVTNIGAIAILQVTTNNAIMIVPKFTVTMRATPTVNLYSNATGASGKLYNASTASDITLGSIYYNGPNGWSYVGTPSGNQTAGNLIIAHYSADAEL